MPDRKLLDALYRKFPLPSYVWQRQVDDFVLVRFNDAAMAATEGAVEALVGKRLTDVYDADSDIVADVRAAFVERKQIQKEIEYEFVSLDLTRSLKTTYFFAEPDLVMIFTEDVTALRTNEKLLSSIVEGISEAVIGVDNAGTITFVNNAALVMFGYMQGELIGKAIELLVPEALRPGHVEHRQSYLKNPRTRRMGENLKLTAQRKDGTSFPVEIGLDFVGKRGSSTAVVALVSDVTERRAFERALEEAATTDPLTALFNRRAFSERLAGEHVRTRRYGRPFVIILGDIDHFKQLNDTRGHDHGDDVLVKVARTLEDQLRDQDVLGRWGGEEFIVLLPETDCAGGVKVAKKLRESVEDAGMTMSFGVAENDGTSEPDSTIVAADRNLYRAKEGGRNRVVS